MTISKALKNNANLAVFTRNHERHLSEALRVSTEQPDRLIPFRARSRWSSAAEALQQGASIPVYIAVVDSGPLVRYVADLRRVIVDPQRGQPETEQLLDLSTSTTRGEGLWETTGKLAGTLFAVSHVRQVSEPFPITDLIKLSNHQPISSDYGYSYTMVYARP